MLPHFNEDGLLPEGIHEATWDEFSARFGVNSWRRKLLVGLRAALFSLKYAGCKTVYVGGSFVTSEEVPNDFDACWDEAGVAPMNLEPVLLMLEPGMVAQKTTYGGELFPASAIVDPEGYPFLEFFQIDKETGNRKGIVAIDLGGLK